MTITNCGNLFGDDEDCEEELDEFDDAFDEELDEEEELELENTSGDLFP